MLNGYAAVVSYSSFWLGPSAYLDPLGPTQLHTQYQHLPL